ncbi:hypothetical protein HOLleu_36517 [Holothuria leucospilota]|uniref:Tetraspanin n=1 Tax=Holothuria leucospilota TaxID=206669 RepID=A0A9Q0YK90_HOLLE|nr:hypothetical protein HOLleu_36517 [Holothuria leucospilota]
MESQSCGTRCVQFILFMLNFIFFLCGLGLIVVSIFIWMGLFDTFGINVIDLASILDNVYLEVGCFIMFAVGILVVIFGIVGCCGAFLLNRVLLGLYFLIVLILFFAQLAGAILAALYSAEIDSYAQTEARDLLVKYYNESRSFTIAIDNFQQKYECCGIEVASDYDGITRIGGRHPDSCCPSPVITASQTECTPYERGCREELRDLVVQNTTIIGATLVGVACLELFLMVFAVLLCRNASEKDDY